jgi:hypothetical protein
MQPIAPIATPLPAVHVAPKHKSSGGKWAVLLFVLALLASFAAGAGKWARYAKLADRFMAPPAPTAPKLPDFALTEPAPPEETPPPDAAASTSASTSPASAPNAPTSTPATTPQPDAGNSPPPPSLSAPNSTATPSTSTAAPAATATVPPAVAPASAQKPKPLVPAASAPSAGAQQRANAAFKENQPASSNQNSVSAAATPTQPMGSVLRGNGPSYIWVAREDRAQDSSRKIQGLGLTSVVIPRPAEGGKRVFVVFSGPFPPARIPSVIDWLRAQGFPNVREVKMPTGEMRGRSSTPNAPNDFDGSSE